MQITPSKAPDQSKTIQSLEKSDLVQNLIVGSAVLLAGGWFLVGEFKPDFQRRATALIIPLMTTCVAAAKFSTAFYNRAAKDGRFDVGDIVCFGQDLPSSEMVAAKILLSQSELQRFEKFAPLIDTEGEVDDRIKATEVYAQELFNKRIQDANPDKL